MSMFKKKSKRKYVKGIINDIRTMTTVTIPQEIARGEYADVNAYISSSRTALNILLIEAMLGAEIKTKGDGEVKFNHHLPNKEQVAEVCQLLSTFMANVENPLLARLTGVVTGEQDEMSIPQFDMKVDGQVKHVQILDKPSNKKLRKEILNHIMRSVKMDVNDCLALSAMGDKARAKANRDKMLIVGGIVILLTGAAVAGLLIYNHRKHDVLKIGDEVVDGDIPSMDDGDIPSIDDGDLPGEDIPRVDID